MYVKKKQFVQETGLPEAFVNRMLQSEWVNMFAQKLSPDKNDNSPWMINKEKALKMIEEGYWR